MAKKDKAHHIRIVINADDHRLVRLAAASMERSMTDFTREAVLSAAAKQMEHFKVPPIPRGAGGSMAQKGV